MFTIACCLRAAMLGAQDHVGFFNGRAGSEHDALQVDLEQGIVGRSGCTCGAVEMGFTMPGQLMLEYIEAAYAQEPVITLGCFYKGGLYRACFTINSGFALDCSALGSIGFWWFRSCQC